MPRRLLKKSRRVRRPRAGAMAEALRKMDGRHWCGLGTVLDKQGGQHWEDHGGEDVTVGVELHPSGTVITCRVASAAGAAGEGVWRVPPVGAEVAVMVPDGEPDAGGIIVGTLSTGAVPAGLSPTTITVQGETVVIRSTGPTRVEAPQVVVDSASVQLGGEGLTALLDGVVVAQGVDPFTGSTYGTLGNASAVVMAKKV